MSNKLFKGKEKNNKDEFEGNNTFKKSRFKGGKFKKLPKGETSIRKGKMFNDISFYTKNPEITKAFGQIPFNWIFGQPLFNAPNNTLRYGAIISFVVDMAFDSKCQKFSEHGSPTILQQVTTMIYTAMRRANAGSTNNIEPADVMISNLLASIDIYANAVNINRIFRTANSFSWRNRLLPQEIFKHFGVDYDDFIAHQADYRGRYNTLVAKAKTIRTLANYPFVNAFMSEFTNIFKDEDTDTGREQIIVPLKGFHHIYDPVGTENLPGGHVRLVKVSDIDPSVSSSNDGPIVTCGLASQPTGFKMSVLLDILNAQIDALITDSDFNLIQADIEKAFGEQSGYLEIDKISEVSEISPVYSGEFMSMFHNGVFVPLLESASSATLPNSVGKVGVIKANKYVNEIYQVPDSATGTAKIQWWCQVDCGMMTNDLHGELYDLNGNTLRMSGVLDSNIQSPTPEDIVVMTRYKTVYNGINSDDIPEDFRPETGGIPGVFISSNLLVFSNMISTYRQDYVTKQVTIERSRWSNSILREGIPAMVKSAYKNVNNYPMLFDGRFGPGDEIAFDFEINNLKWLSPGELDGINLACFLSLWDLPSKTNI